MRYSTAVVARVRAMARVGAWPEGPGVGTGEAGSLDEGTFVRVQVRTSGRGYEAVYKVFGCGAAIASASLVAEWIEQERAVTVAGVTAELDLPPARAHAAGLAVTAGERALAAVAQAANSELRIADSEQRTANSEQRTANGEQRTANSEQRIANSE